MYCGTAARMGTAGTAARYCAVPKKDRRADTFLGKFPQYDPGIELRPAGMYGDVIIIAPPLRVIIGWLIIGLFTP